MKRITKILSIFIGLIIIIIVAILLSLHWLIHRPCLPPEKPHIVPESAIWNGGCDGGEWIELIEINKDKYRFRIYQDWSGELKIDADFKSKDDKIKLNLMNWKDVVYCYSEDSLVTLSFVKATESKKQYYQLQAIYPAYGGSSWQIIKGKYNIQ